MTDPIAALIAGHGGELSGQNGGEVGKFIEDDWALDVCCVTDAILGPFPSIMIREYDEKISLEERGYRIQERGAGLAISVHADVRPAGSPCGCFAFSWPGNYRGEVIAKEILSHMPEPLRRDGDVKSANSRWPRVRNVLQPHPADCISILLEVGDVVDAKTREYLLSQIGRHRVALAIAAGVLYWMD